MSVFSRRLLLKLGGLSLAGLWSPKTEAAGSPPTQKTMYLPPESTTDPAALSRAENLFWTDIMMEHAGFFVLLMPGPELAGQRSEAEAFQRTFQSQFDRARTAPMDRSAYAAFNRSTAGLIKPFVEFKQRMLQAQNSGKIRSLVFSSFFDHTAREAIHAANRLEHLAAGDATQNYADVVDFWAGIMSEHGNFIAHMLDPEEQDLISQAADESAVFQGLRLGNRRRPVPR